MLAAEQPRGQPGAGVDVQRAADGADRHRHGELADEVRRGAVVVDVPGRQRAVAAVAGGEGMRPGLDRAPVLAGGDQHRVDAVR
ncbi:MAG: hypothetical protein R2939_17070 [Kofleriaceae bacterium]